MKFFSRLSFFILMAAACALFTACQKTSPIAPAAKPIRIGDIGAYTGGTLFAEPARHGWQLALEEINRSGGIHGRPLEIISRDSSGDSGAAVRLAEELKARDGAILLICNEYSRVSMAVSSWAQQNKFVTLFPTANTSRIAWEEGHRYAFCTTIRAYSFSSALARSVHPATQLEGASFASIAGNDEYGHSCVDNFQRSLEKNDVHPRWVAQQWPAYGKIDAGAEINILARADPRIVHAPLYGSDLASFIREARLRGFLQGRQFISETLGLTESLKMLDAETPEGWHVIGLPWLEISTPEFKTFLAAFHKKFPGETPTYWAMHGYDTLKLIAAALKKGPTLSSEDLIAALESVQIPSPFGVPLSIRKIDHQVTGGFWVGKTAVRDGKPQLVDWTFERVVDHMPTDAEILQWRRQPQSP